MNAERLHLKRDTVRHVVETAYDRYAISTGSDGGVHITCNAGGPPLRLSVGEARCMAHLMNAAMDCVTDASGKGVVFIHMGAQRVINCVRSRSSVRVQVLESISSTEPIAWFDLSTAGVRLFAEALIDVAIYAGAETC